jgi:hypothetical protein
MKPFEVNQIIKLCELGPKLTISYHLGRDVTNTMFQVGPNENKATLG